MNTASTRRDDRNRQRIAVTRTVAPARVGFGARGLGSPHPGWAAAIAARLGAHAARPWPGARRMTFLRLRGLRTTLRETVVLRHAAGSLRLAPMIHFTPREAGPVAPGALAKGRQAAPAQTRILINTSVREAGGRIGNPVVMRLASRHAGGPAGSGNGPAPALPGASRMVGVHPQVKGFAPRPGAGGGRPFEIPAGRRHGPDGARLGEARIAPVDVAEPIMRRYRRVDRQPPMRRGEAANSVEWARGTRDAAVTRGEPARRRVANDKRDVAEREPMDCVPEPAAPINVAQITDAVLQQLDRRLIAARERMGRI